MQPLLECYALVGMLMKSAWIMQVYFWISSHLLTQSYTKWVYSSFVQIIKIIEDTESLVLAGTFRYTSSWSIFLNMHRDEHCGSKIEICPLLFLDSLLQSLLDLMKQPLNNAVCAITSLFCSSLKLGKSVRRLCSLSSATAAFVYAW